MVGLGVGSGSESGSGLGLEAEVVVVLLGELLHHQVVERGHLLGEDLGGLEALGKEHDLDDERDVGSHHRDRPQQRLEGLGVGVGVGLGSGLGLGLGLGLE